MVEYNLINKFENGEERFNNSALFKVVIMNLLNGVSEIKIIDDLIKMNEKLTEDYKEHIMRSGGTPIIIPDNN